MNRFDKLYESILAKDLKKGDEIKNTNPDCEHAGSEGEVESIEKLPNKSDKSVKNKNNMPGRLIKYKVKNSGKNFKTGDTLYKTADQLDKK